MRRDALVTSGCSTPTPSQNSFRPPPEPVDSMTGVLKPEVLPKVSATAVANGENGRRTYDLDLVACFSSAGECHYAQRSNGK